MKFLVLYFVLNVLYGLYVESFDQADAITYWVTVQSAEVISWFADGIGITPHETRSTVLIYNDLRYVLSVYEGCNGINVMIVFLSFLLAFPGWSKKLLWFAPLGLLLIHIFNIGRIVFLYWVAESLPNLYYFTHKYVFTAIIYLVVFVLWYVWVAKMKPGNA